MKKNLKVLMYSMAAVMMVSGCSKKTDSAADTTAGTTAAETTEASQAAGETAGTEGSEAETGSAGRVDWGRVESLGSYKGVVYTPMSTEISDEEVEAQIQSLLAANPVIREVERPAEEGDIVNIDYVGKKDGVAFDGGTASGYDLTLGSGQFIDGFEDGLIGTAAGDKVNLDLTFPEEYHSEELAGQAVVFEVTVNTVKESAEAELNDEFIAANTGSATVDEYRKAVREDLEETARLSAENQKMSDVLMKVVEDSEVTVPEESVETVYQEQRAYYEQQVQMFGMDLETWVSYYGIDMETFESDLRTEAAEACKSNAVIMAVAEAENITVEDGDREQLAADYGYPDVDTMIEDAGEDAVDERILMEKAIQFIADNAVEG